MTVNDLNIMFENFSIRGDQWFVEYVMDTVTYLMSVGCSQEHLKVRFWYQPPPDTESQHLPISDGQQDFFQA